MAKGRNPEFIKVEKFINSGKGTIADYRRLNPGSPEFKVKIGSIANKNAIVSYSLMNIFKAVFDILSHHLIEGLRNFCAS